MILVIDDDYSITASLGLLLKQAGYAFEGVSRPEQALEALDRSDLELIIQDMNFSRVTTGQEGLDLLQAIKAKRPRLPVILITAWGSIELAVEGMKAGAADFITKPWRNEQVLHSVRSVLDVAAQRSRPAPTPQRANLDTSFDLTGIVGEDPAFLAVLDMAARVASTDASVLLTGETGTGKEVVAEMIHRNSARHRAPFVRVNLGGVPPALFESEMFGHVKGAFTDARQDRRGRFDAAEGGTIFLDEIGELDASCQVKLLRVLQDRRYEALGSSASRPLDVRVISATNQDLTAAIAAGRFREDLLYRINLIHLRLPSLSERPGDVVHLARHYLHQAASSYDRDRVQLDASAETWLRRQPWPGNVRQLKHLMARTVLLSAGSTLTEADFQRTLTMDGDEPADSLPSVGSMTMEEIERAMIVKSMRHHAGNVSRVAESLGLSRAALYRRFEKYGIEP